MRRSRSLMPTFPSSGSPPCCRARRRRRWCDARVRSRGSSRATTCSTSSPESTDAGRGEGGILQAVLDVIAVPYTGSGALASALAMDKDLAKRLFRAAGVPVPAWFMAPVAPEDVTTALGWPVIVKPSKMGSSVGMTLVRNAEGLDAAVLVARAYDAEVMAEQFIPGRELTVGVLGDVPLPVGEIIPKHELFDYECKYTPGMSEEIFPAKLDTTLARQLQELAL